MSQENVELIRQSLDAFERGELSVALTRIHQDCVSSRVAPLPDVMDYHGPDGMMQMLLDWVADFDEFSMTAEEYLDSNDRQVTVRIRQKAVGKQSGAPVEGEYWFVYTLGDGKAKRLQIYGSEDQAFEATRPAGHGAPG